MSMGQKNSFSLRERLQHAVQQHRVSVSGSSSDKPEATVAPADLPDTRPPLAEVLGGEWVETEHGPTFIHDEEFPLTHLHGKLPLNALLSAPRNGLKNLFQSSTAAPAHTYGFFDIETTGLSGGTGTYCFLAALGTFASTTFRVRQYFLADVLQERAFLTALARDLQQCTTLVTYNGRCFDQPCIETRLLLSRLPSPFDRPHLDLLYPMRRLYRDRLESCRLGCAETDLLGFERVDDVPGWQVPTIYFDYLRARRLSPLRGVLRHNRDDILSTLGVLAHLVEMLGATEPAPDDALALARWWEGAARPDRACDLYSRALPAMESSGRWARAAERYALLLKRAGEREEACGLWWRLWERGCRPAGLELAKHLEHRAHEFAAAKTIAQHLLETAEEPERPALAHRIARLERKQKKNG